jgi:hypothetical protein
MIRETHRAETLNPEPPKQCTLRHPKKYRKTIERNDNEMGSSVKLKYPFTKLVYGESMKETKLINNPVSEGVNPGAGEGAFPPTQYQKLAIGTEYVEFLLQNDVAIVVKKPIYLDKGCGARTRAIFKSPFVVRGGVKLFPTSEKIDEHEVILKRKLRYAELYVIKVDNKTRLGISDGYLVFEKISDNEYKLVDDEPTHLLYIYHHYVRSRSKGAKILTNLPQQSVLKYDRAICATASDALLAAIVPINSAFILCENDPPYRGERDELYYCYEIKATLPPTKKMITETPDPESLLRGIQEEII